MRGLYGQRRPGGPQDPNRRDRDPQHQDPNRFPDQDGPDGQGSWQGRGRDPNYRAPHEADDGYGPNHGHDSHDGQGVAEPARGHGPRAPDPDTGYGHARDRGFSPADGNDGYNRRNVFGVGSQPRPSRGDGLGQGGYAGSGSGLGAATAAPRTADGKTLTPDTPVEHLRGAGPYMLGLLEQLDVRTVGDLLLHLPLRYEDRRHFVPLAGLQEGTESLVRGRVVSADVRFGGRRTLRVVIADDSGGTLLLRLFHFHENQRRLFEAGRWVRAFGAVRQSSNGFEMVHPEFRVAHHPDELVADTSLTPIYPLTSGLSQAKMRSLVQNALETARFTPPLNEPLPGFPDGAMSTYEALKLMHQPTEAGDAALLLEGSHPAQMQLVREELLAHQLAMRQLRKNALSQHAPSIEGMDAAADELEAVLPFTFTDAQNRVAVEIADDLESGDAMTRLVQGDVGSGKTAVAAIALLAAARAGYQGAFMAPTELLAEQHFRTLSGWLAPLGVDVVFVAGKQKKSEREVALSRLADGRAHLAVGTHALFQDSAVFAKLGLIVVDEQHRFGVQQRMKLRDKGPEGTVPHQLIMSATPIPRTLAQTLYADLDVSVIDEMPPGRTPVTTVAMAETRRPELIERLRQATRDGRQVYWVCALIEESESEESQAAEETAARLREELPEATVGLVHGRMKASEKEAEMARFKRNETRILVATTVIEVGVDVPNASIMIIENAERFGLAQLHQLRGRVGRGAAVSQCVLLYRPPLGPLGRARLETLRDTTDGFVIAEKDLELRGPGELLGRRQTGEMGLKMANPARHADEIPFLQKLADTWLDEHTDDAERLRRFWIGAQDRFARV